MNFHELLSDAHVWVALGVVVFIALMWKPVGKVVVKTLDARADKIRKELNDAEALVREADTLLAQYERRQQEATAQAEHMLRQAREESDGIRKRAMEEVEIALAAREKHAMDRIRQAENAALQQIRQTTISLAMATARKVINDNMDDDTAEKLMVGSLDHLGRKPN